jgi:prepilin-type N-terminal cleavage/methylation domain-containing protein
MRNAPRSGVTLVELVVALCVVGLVAAVVGIAIPRATPPIGEGAVAQAVMAARQTAITSGHATTVDVTVKGTLHSVTASPDGLIVADSALGIDPLSGAPVTEPRTTSASDAPSR